MRRSLLCVFTLCRRFSRPLHPVAGGSLCALAVLALLAGFVPGRRGGELRLPFSQAAPTERTEQAEQTELAERAERTKWVDRRPLDTTVWMLRRPISTRPVAPSLASPVGDEDALLTFSAGNVNILTTEGPRRVRPNALGMTANGAGGDDLFQRLSRQSLGLPADRSLAAPVLIAGRPAALCVPPPGSEALRATSLRRAWRAGGASPYSATVDVYANKFGLDRRLIYAIMYTESGFDPTSVSNRDAHGLMQIVPGSAGHEVHTYLHGVPGRPDAATLLNPFTNIQYGVTYLHLLLRRHMAGIEDPLAREYCAVASYNIGPNAVLKVFGSGREGAFAAINALSPMEVYAALIERLPAAETRTFLRKVMLVKAGLPG